MKRNPKQADSNLYDCIPQVGPCPIGCNQCFYNRPGAFYLPINQPHFPSLEEVGDGIVRVNCGNDSNNQREHVIASTAHYPRRFFNTSIPELDFPSPVVLTANSKEEQPACEPTSLLGGPPSNLMFVRLRASSRWFCRCPPGFHAFCAILRVKLPPRRLPGSRSPSRVLAHDIQVGDRRRFRTREPRQ